MTRKELLPAAAVGAVITLVYALWSWRQWVRMEVPSWDLGIFTQVARAYAEFRAPIVPIKGPDFMILGDHFHPILVLLAPAYWIHPSGYTLLFVQALLFGISAVIVTASAMRHLGRWPGVAIGLSYGLSWGLQSAVASQFHEIAFAMPLLAMSLAAMVRRHHRTAVLWAAPLVLVKEDLGLTVAAIGLVVLLRGGRKLGAATIAFGVLAFVLTTKVILPALNPDGVWDYADDSIVSLLATDPGAAFGHLFTGFGQKLLLVVLVFGVTLLLSLRSPLALVTLPTFAWRVTSDVPFHWSTDWHYSAVLMPIVFLAMVDAIQAKPDWKFNARYIAGAALVLSLVACTQFSLKKLLDDDYWTPGPRPEAGAVALAAIPDDATVVSDITLMAYLAPRTQVYWMGNDNPVPQYVVLYANSGIYSGAPPSSAEAWAEERFPGEDFVQIVDDQGFLVAEHVGQSGG